MERAEESIKKPIVLKVESALRKAAKELSLNDIRDRIGVRNPDWIIDALDVLMERGIVTRKWTRKGGGKTVYCIIAQGNSDTETAGAAAFAADDGREDACTEQSGSHQINADMMASDERDDTDSLNDKNERKYISRLYDHLIAELKKKPEWKSVAQLIINNAWPLDSVQLLPPLLAELANAGIVEFRTEQDETDGKKTEVRYLGDNGYMLPETVIQILGQVQCQDDEKTQESSVASANSVSEFVIEDSPAEKAEAGVGAVSDFKYSQMPYGYEETDGNVSINSKEAEVVRLIFKMHAQGKSPADISDYLSDTGITSRMGSHFYPSTVSRLLHKSEIYKGKEKVLGRICPAILNEKNRAAAGLDRFTAGNKETVTVQRRNDGESFGAMGNLPDNLQLGREDKTDEDDDRNTVKHEEGHNISQVLYGYRKKPDGNLAIAENEANIVRAVYKMRSRGMILQEITDRLNLVGCRTRNGNHFYPSAISGILKKQRFYQGIVTAGRNAYPVILGRNFRTEYNAIADYEIIDPEMASDQRIISKGNPSGSSSLSDTVATGVRSLPFGYEYIDREVKKDSYEAECVKMLFDLYDKGTDKSIIAERLAAKGFRGRDGKKIDYRLVIDIIGKRQLYTGISGYPQIIAEKVTPFFPESGRNKTENVSAKSGIASDNVKSSAGLFPEKPIAANDASNNDAVPAHEPISGSGNILLAEISEKRSEATAAQEPENVVSLKEKEDIQEEIFRVLFTYPGFLSVAEIKNLSPGLQTVPDYKIIFNANIMSSRNLIYEKITNPPDIKYLYSSKLAPTTEPIPVLSESMDEKTPGTVMPAEQTADYYGKERAGKADGLDQEDQRKRRVAGFIDYCRTTPLVYAYKMVLILALLEVGNAAGTADIDEVAAYFRRFYSDRRNKHLKIEKGPCIYDSPSVPLSMIRRNIIDNPIRALVSGGYFQYDSRNGLFNMKNMIWTDLKAGDKVVIKDICRKRLEDYFEKI